MRRIDVGGVSEESQSGDYILLYLREIRLVRRGHSGSFGCDGHGGRGFGQMDCQARMVADKYRRTMILNC